jgi:hypothetical protein
MSQTDNRSTTRSLIHLAQSLRRSEQVPESRYSEESSLSDSVVDFRQSTRARNFEGNESDNSDSLSTNSDMTPIMTSSSYFVTAPRRTQHQASPARSEGSGISSYAATNPAEEVLRIRTDGLLASGRVRRHNPGGEINVIAMVDPNLSCNIVSQMFAAKAGLEVEEPEHGNQVQFEVESGRIVRALGQVVLKWSKELAPHRSISVPCWVVAHGNKFVILGKPFLDKQKHYVGVRRGTDR